MLENVTHFKNMFFYQSFFHSVGQCLFRPILLAAGQKTWLFQFDSDCWCCVPDWN